MKPEVYFSFGCSGCGKSTRIYQMIKYLKTKYRESPLFYQNTVVGLQFSEIGLAIIGTEVLSKGIRKWQGLDSYTGVFGSAENIVRFIESASREVTLVVEGSGILLSNRYRPKYFYTETKIRRTHGRIYAFQNFEQYQERIMGRSGYTIESKAMWVKNQGFISYMNSYSKELEEIGNPKDASYEISLSTWDAPVTEEGDFILRDLGLDLNEFHEWSKENDFAKAFILPPKKGFF